MAKKSHPATEKPTRRTFTGEFKREAVQMMIDRHAASSIAKNLRIGNSNLLYRSKWACDCGYALNQRQPLSVYLQDGRLPIHNNDTEQSLRRLTIGRKNWMFLGSEAGGEVASRLYTITASALRHNLDVWAYLDDVLRHLAGGEADVGSLLPDAWTKSHPDAIRSYREVESLARDAGTKARRASRRKLTQR
jgi:transposase